MKIRPLIALFSWILHTIIIIVTRLHPQSTLQLHVFQRKIQPTWFALLFFQVWFLIYWLEFDVEPLDESIVVFLTANQLDFHELFHFKFSKFLYYFSEEVLHLYVIDAFS